MAERRGGYRYLRMMEPEAAWAALAARVPPGPLGEEEVAAQDACGRVTARAHAAALSSPFFHGAAMDGYALAAAATAGASEARPARLRVGDGGGAAARPIDTGDPLPAGADAVVMIEHAPEPEPGWIELDRAVAPWQHVRLTGEDVVQGEIIVPRGKHLSAYDVGALLGAGCLVARVAPRPRVALIPTGDEVIEPAALAAGPPPPGAVIDFNTPMLAALVAGWGGAPVAWRPVRDDAGALGEALAAALASCDVVVLNAGSSAGRADHTPAVIAAAGELLVHGVNVMPGKPTALGVARGKPVLGLPGYPVSAAVAADLFLRPLLARLLGVAPARRASLRAHLPRKLPSKSGHQEVVRVQLGRVGGRVVATPLARGAGVLTSLARAAGLVRVPAASEGLAAGSEVEVELLVPPEQVDATWVHVGSHDLTLDLLGDLLRGARPDRHLSSANAGSLGGLLALGRGECHLAGTHLLDPEGGDYNVPYLRRYLPGRRVALVHLVRREQGLLVAPGNPRAIRGLSDLARADVRFVNRQRGAGTRVLLDARLAEAGVAPERIAGYRREEHTHMAVAVAVAGGVADAGLGIRAAAQALGLGFEPLESEPYELALAAETLAELAPLLEVVASDAFARAAEALGGYDASGRGAVRLVDG